MDPELEQLAQALRRSLAANRFDEARDLADRCVALHNAETHRDIVCILESARRLAMVQRALASTRLANLQSSNQYTPAAGDPSRYIVKG